MLNGVNPCTIYIFAFRLSMKKKDTCQREIVTFSWESVRESHDSQVITSADTALHSSSRIVAIRGGQVANYMRHLANAVSTVWSNIWRIYTTSTCRRYRGDSLPQPSANVGHPIAISKPRCLCFHGSCIRTVSNWPSHYSSSSRYKDPIDPTHSGWLHSGGCNTPLFCCFVA